LPSRNEQKKHRIVIVDDHHIVRYGLIQLLNSTDDLELCGEAEDMATALEIIEKSKPDLVVVDISLKGSDGLELIKQINAKFPAILTLVLSMHEESVYAERALRAGAMGYIMKQEMNEILLDAIYHLLEGNIFLSGEMTDRILHKITLSQSGEAHPSIDDLTDRQFQIFKLIGQGFKIGEIAEKLYISVSTAEYHRANIRKKMDIPNSAELTRVAVKWMRDTFK